MLMKVILFLILFNITIYLLYKLNNSNLKPDKETDEDYFKQTGIGIPDVDDYYSED